MVWTTPNAGNVHGYPESFNISCQTTFIWYSCCQTQKSPFLPDRQLNGVVWIIWSGWYGRLPMLGYSGLTWSSSVWCCNHSGQLLIAMFHDLGTFWIFSPRQTDRPTDWQTPSTKIMTSSDLAVYWLNYTRTILKTFRVFHRDFAKTTIT